MLKLPLPPAAGEEALVGDNEEVLVAREITGKQRARKLARTEI